MSNTINDPDNYAAMSRPFDTVEELDAALKGFCDELYELRNKYRMSDVAIIVKASVAGSGPLLMSGHFGNETEAEGMAGWYFGRASANRQETIRRAVEQGASASVKNVKTKKGV